MGGGIFLYCALYKTILSVLTGLFAVPPHHRTVKVGWVE